MAIFFIIGGGVGNLIDRMSNNGAVIDSMNIGVGNLRTEIFNLADIAIMIGVGMLIFMGHKHSESGNTFEISIRSLLILLIYQNWLTYLPILV